MADYFPEELIVEILCRLPVKTLLRCIVLSKSWYDLIKTPNFIATHLHKTLSSDDHRLFLHRLYGNNDETFRLYFDNNDFGEYMTPHPPCDTKKHLHVAGSCNGLICLFRDDFSHGFGYGYRFILWNPSIRKSILLPSPHFIFANNFLRCRNFTGFGFDPTTQDYKVLRIMNLLVDDWIHFRADVYSLNSNSWKDITDIVPRYRVHESVTPAFVNGALHWIATENNYRNFIMVFDVRDDVFREMMLPESLANAWASELTVQVFQESVLAVIYRETCRDYESHIWLMLEYGRGASWVKLATLRNRMIERSKVLGFRKNGEVLMYTGEVGQGVGDIASVDIGSRMFKNPIAGNENEGGPFLYNYMESLALLDKGNMQCPSDAKQTKISNGWLEAVLKANIDH